MSIVNISVHQGYGIVSVDTCISKQLDAQGNLMKDCEVLAERANAAGHPPAVVSGRASKLVSLPHLQAVAGSIGSAALIGGIHVSLANLDCADIAEFPTTARKVLQDTRLNFCKIVGKAGRRAGILTTIAGYSPSLKAVIGWTFTHEDDFKMRPVTAPGTNPPIDKDGENIEMLRGLLITAGSSIAEARALHLEIASNQYQAYKAGKYPAGYHCSNEIHIATVTAEAINITREFVAERRPDCAPGLVNSVARGLG